MSPPRIYFVNRFYWPDTPATAQLLTDLGEALVRSGFLVTVVTSGKPDSPIHEIREGVEIHRVSKQNVGSGLVPRAWAFITFVRAARAHLAESIRSGDCVVALTDPPLLGLALDRVARKSGASMIHWIQDIFPEVFTAVSGKRLPKCLTVWRNRAWQRARLCITPGEEMAAFVAAQGVAAAKIRVCPNWAPKGLTPVVSTNWRHAQNLEGRFVIMYSGNLGRVHDFSAIVPMMTELANDPEIVLVVSGHGAKEPALRSAVTTARLGNVRFLDPSSRDNLGETLSAADLHLITLKPGCESLVFPSKLYGIAAVGKPALVLGPVGCEVGRQVEEHNFGAAFAHNDWANAASFVRQLKSSPPLRSEVSHHALSFATTQGRAENAFSLWQEYLHVAEAPLTNRPVE